jgi:putative Ca2+/H+ antiporter (TMEM165/GDT1 family)
VKNPASPSSLSAFAVSQPDFRLQSPAESAANADLPPSVAIATEPCQEQVRQELNLGALGVFSSTFATIFLAEMGDKTQLATLLMSAESQSPWTVFAGASVALIATSLVGILLGRWLAKFLTPKTLNFSAGILLLSISVLLFWEVLNS